MRFLTLLSLVLFFCSPDAFAQNDSSKGTSFRRPFSLTLKQSKRFQILKFHGGFNKETPYRNYRSITKKLIAQKDILLIIERGYGGSVKDHKRFAKDLRLKCKGSCEIVTYIDGQCSSMCTTLFLHGDIRLARNHESANLAFHRTLVRIGGRSIPIQSVRSMVRYFSKFQGVCKDYLETYKNRLFKTKNNALSKVSESELIRAGFATELFDANRGDYRELYHHLGLN